MDYVALVIVLAIIQYFFFVGMVGKARGQYSVSAPATTGNEMFERVYRVQQNTLEQLMIFIPVLYLFALYIHALAAAGIGVLFLLGRMVYYRSYIADPASRGTGMMLGFLACLILMTGSLVGIILALIKT